MELIPDKLVRPTSEMWSQKFKAKVSKLVHVSRNVSPASVIVELETSNDKRDSPWLPMTSIQESSTKGLSGSITSCEETQHNIITPLNQTFLADTTNCKFKDSNYSTNFVVNFTFLTLTSTTQLVNSKRLFLASWSLWSWIGCFANNNNNIFPLAVHSRRQCLNLNNKQPIPVHWGLNSI